MSLTEASTHHREAAQTSLRERHGGSESDRETAEPAESSEKLEKGRSMGLMKLKGNKGGTEGGGGVGGSGAGEKAEMTDGYAVVHAVARNHVEVQDPRSL